MELETNLQNVLDVLTVDHSILIVGVLLLLTAAFLLGAVSRSSHLWKDRLATRRIRRSAYYQVGDRVTLGNNLHGVVTMITPVSTLLTTSAQGLIIISNSVVLQHPIQVHPIGVSSLSAVEAPVSTMTTPEPILESEPIITPPDDEVGLPVDDQPMSSAVEVETKLLPQAALPTLEVLPILEDHPRHDESDNTLLSAAPTVARTPDTLPPLRTLPRLTMRRTKLGQYSVRQLTLHQAR